MRSRFFTVLVLMALFITYANAKFIEYESKIISIDGRYATIKNSDSFRVGSSGVVVHNFGKNHSSIVAKVIAVSKDGESAKVVFKRFDDLKQDVLPVPKVLPTVGDKVILNYLYNHALPIAPNYKTYNKIITKYPSISWLHPDLFAAKLFSESNPSPNREDFKAICKDYSFSLLYFALNNRGYFVDCNSFKVLKEESLDTGDKKMLPFYSRIKDIDTSWLSFGKSKISNYDNYYKMLLR